MNRSLLAAVAALVLLSGAACGAGEGEADLAAAADRTVETGSSRFTISGTAKLGDGTERFACSGAANYAEERLRLNCAYGPSRALEVVAIGTTMYMRGEILGFGSLDRSAWIRMDDDESFAELITPQRLLALLRGASTRTERVGEEQVRGADTVRYRLEVECEAAELDCDGATAPVDVWVDDDGLVRRIEVDEQASSFTLEFHALGEPVDVEPPPPGDVRDLGAVSGSGPCAPGFGDPVGLGQAMDAVRRYGFSIPEREPLCVAGVASFGNGTAPLEAEGRVSCYVRATAPAGAPRSVLRRGADGADAELSLANVECVLLADSPDAETKIDRLEEAFAELERTIRN